ncbi:MAG: RNase adapter RapZ [Holophagales bacterium]|jgi:UPF0042 nucleotide-binding protein|nr:RNase adapter RapZ [Holophagales bacterium]
MSIAELVIVTGLSGAGRRSVLGVLEDTNFVALDNVPFQLLGPLLELENKAQMSGGHLAVGMDSRQMEFHKHFVPMLEQLHTQEIRPFILYLECEDEILIRRYSESRRPHRMTGDGTIAEGIAKERDLLRDVKEHASIVLDTSYLTLYQLRQRITEILPKCRPAETCLNIMSFGFKHGIPVEADMVFDARFLPNPFYVPDLRPLTGLDNKILTYLKQFKQFNEFTDRIEDWLMWSWPHILEEGKAYHTIAIGCTGGQHRSVALAKELSERLIGRIENLNLQHREL